MSGRLAVIAVALVAACASKQESTAQVVERHRGAVQAQLDRALALHDAVAAAPAAAAAPTRPIAMLGARADQGGDTALVHLDDLVELEPRGDDELRVSGSRLLLDCASLLRDGRTTDVTQPKPAGAEDLLRRCEQVEVLAVVRIRELVEPTGGILFTPGSISGDLVYVALVSGEVLGGFGWQASSSDEVRMHLGGDSRGPLRKNLASQMNAAVRRGLPR